MNRDEAKVTTRWIMTRQSHTPPPPPTPPPVPVQIKSSRKTTKALRSMAAKLVPLKDKHSDRAHIITNDHTFKLLLCLQIIVIMYFKWFRCATPAASVTESSCGRGVTRQLDIITEWDQADVWSACFTFLAQPGLRLESTAHNLNILTMRQISDPLRSWWWRPLFLFLLFLCVCVFYK